MVGILGHGFDFRLGERYRASNPQTVDLSIDLVNPRAFYVGNQHGVVLADRLVGHADWTRIWIPD